MAKPNRPNPRARPVDAFADPSRPPYPKEEATRRVHELVSGCFSGQVEFKVTDHFARMLRERQFPFPQVLAQLQGGSVREEPEFEHGEWRYRVRCPSGPGKKPWLIVVSFEAAQRLAFVTVFDTR